MNFRRILTVALLIHCLMGTSAKAETFIKGLAQSIAYCPVTQGDESCPTFHFTTSGKTMKAVLLYWQGKIVAAVDDGNRDIIFQGTKPVGPAPSSGCILPDIGGDGSSSLRSNEYVLGAHDFSGDGQPDLLLGVRDRKGDGLAIFVFRHDGRNWQCIGEMATRGRHITEARVFRQTLSFKDGAVMHSWTWHGNRFDYLSSDKANDPSRLF